MFVFEPITAGTQVEVRWQGDQWLPATVTRVYERGADCMVGDGVAEVRWRGEFYVRFEDIRARTEDR